MAKEPIEHESLEPRFMENPQSFPEPELASGIQEEPTTEPEPAIKFDIIDSEDYGDGVEQKNLPDAVDDEIISTLVDRFLNTGSLENKNAPKFSNPAAQALIGSSDYWKTDNFKPIGSIKDDVELKKWMDGYQTEAQKVLKEVAASSWRYFSNASPQLKLALDEIEDVSARFVRTSSMQAKQFDMESVKDPQLKRMLSFVTFEGMSALSTESYTEFSKALSKDRVAYPGGECSHGQDCLLDSHCNGTVCVCDEGKFTLDFGGFISCTDGNPSEGFPLDEEGVRIVPIPPTPARTTTPRMITARKMNRQKSSSNTMLSIVPAFVLLYLTL